MFFDSSQHKTSWDSEEYSYINDSFSW